MKLSILVTAYNAASTIERCLDSLVCQDLEDYEIIVVNDGSKDATAEIVNSYESKYPHVKLISQPNGGVSKARNTAMHAALGEYITYVDSDDYVAENTYGMIMKKAEEGYDIVVYDGYFDDGEKLDYFKMAKCSQGEMSAKDYFMSEPCPWNKVMRKALFDKTGDFEVDMIYEDYALIPRLANSMKKAYYLATPVVYYYQSADSIMRGDTYKKKAVDIIKASKILADGSMDHFHDEVEAVIYEHLLQNGCRYFLQYDKYEELNLAADFMRAYFPKWRQNSYLKERSFKEKLIGQLFYMHQAKLVKKLVNIKNK